MISSQGKKSHPIQQPPLDDGMTRSIDRVLDELTLLEQMLTLDGMRILDLGCGNGSKTRAIATAGSNRQVIGLEVDKVQHANNIALSDTPPNIEFQLGAADHIPAESDFFDVVLLFKSLHHVQDLDKSMDEIVRVLKPGSGKVWISEPLCRGDFNEVLKLFHDESAVRRAAFHAIGQSVECGKLELVSQTFFLSARHYTDFADFERRVIGGVTSTWHCLSTELLEQVRARFQEFVGNDGAHFLQPIRVDLLRKPLSKARLSP